MVRVNAFLGVFQLLLICIFGFTGDADVFSIPGISFLLIFSGPVMCIAASVYNYIRRREENAAKWCRQVEEIHHAEDKNVE